MVPESLLTRICSLSERLEAEVAAYKRSDIVRSPFHAIDLRASMLIVFVTHLQQNRLVIKQMHQELEQQREAHIESSRRAADRIRQLEMELSQR